MKSLETGADAKGVVSYETAVQNLESQTDILEVEGFTLHCNNGKLGRGLWHAFDKHLIAPDSHLIPMTDGEGLSGPIDVVRCLVSEHVHRTAISRTAERGDVTVQAPSKKFRIPVGEPGTTGAVKILDIPSDRLDLKLKFRARGAMGDLATFFMTPLAARHTHEHWFEHSPDGEAGQTGVVSICDCWGSIGDRSYADAQLRQDLVKDGDRRPLLPEWDAEWFRPVRDYAGVDFGHFSCVVATGSPDAPYLNAHVLFDITLACATLDSAAAELLTKLVDGDISVEDFGRSYSVADFLSFAGQDDPHIVRDGDRFVLLPPATAESGDAWFWKPRLG